MRWAEHYQKLFSREKIITGTDTAIKDITLLAATEQELASLFTIVELSRGIDLLVSIRHWRDPTKVVKAANVSLPSPWSAERRNDTTRHAGCEDRHPIRDKANGIDSNTYNRFSFLIGKASALVVLSAFNYSLTMYVSKVSARLPRQAFKSDMVFSFSECNHDIFLHSRSVGNFKYCLSRAKVNVRCGTIQGMLLDDDAAVIPHTEGAFSDSSLYFRLHK
ncbi:hypothetical protein ElyMa_006218800 [Elysia marginata]|uniref:Uncharacterized protein n=1 Tax=Elysia marginata TaxID=1093978 RepID=A0AAV4H7T8_9GAST|nr:hypothetical protein ElyMa_006218800 [Elysia marginata]